LPLALDGEIDAIVTLAFYRNSKLIILSL